jgi:uncharacterized protein YciI
MKYFLLFYEVVEEFAKKREPYRPKHLGLVDDAHGRGELVLAGAYGDPPSGAALLFRADSADVVRKFAEADPYVTSGLVSRWTVHPWHVVIGEGSSR